MKSESEIFQEFVRTRKELDYFRTKSDGWFIARAYLMGLAFALDDKRIKKDLLK